MPTTLDALVLKHQEETKGAVADTQKPQAGPKANHELAGMHSCCWCRWQHRDLVVHVLHKDQAACTS